MLTIEILHNLPELQADLTDLMKQQLPFATSLALNATIKDVRRRIVFSTWPKAFTVRNKPFPGVVFRMKFSNKSTLEAMVFDQLGRDFIERHVTGGTKRPVSGANLAIPLNVRRTGGGRIPKSMKPRTLTAKKSTRIVRGKSGHNLIVETYKGDTIVRYVLSPAAKIEARFRFYEDAIDTVNRVINGHWNTSMRRAIRTKRTLALY